MANTAQKEANGRQDMLEQTRLQSKKVNHTKLKCRIYVGINDIAVDSTNFWPKIPISRDSLFKLTSL